MKKLGIDVGSYGSRFVLTDENGKILFKESIPHHNKVKETILDSLNSVKEITGSEAVMISVCGSMCHLLSLPDDYMCSEITALNTGVELYYPQAASWCVIGSQNTLYIEKENGKKPKIRRNSNCSSGTGSFFEEQAGRLGIETPDISKLIDHAKTVPHIAGRCSVFSKTDMIHHMQEGTPTEDLLLGICYSLVRNYRSNILQNHNVKTPFLLLGGVMNNSGVIRAIKELFSLTDSDIILDDNREYLPAMGCASIASHKMTLEELSDIISNSQNTTTDSGLPPLYPFIDKADDFDYTTAPMTPGKAWLGIDIGSTSINLVLINKNKEIIYYSYVKNLGKPLDVVKFEIQKLKSKLPCDVTVENIAVTGSGRERIGKEIGAGLIINEITAQTEGALIYRPKTETIFEIGGQDSKYMSIKKGNMTDFEMNKVCAAGTGAFLEEQIKKLGISIQDFLKLALKSEHPCALGDRCTVFIESSITKALAEGNKLEDVCAGLAYAIANNYLNRVINKKAIGDTIAIQGGIAYNEAVICAFRSLTGKKIHVSPWFSVTGALGAASLCTNKGYINFDKEKNQALNRTLNEATEQAYLGNYKEPDGKKPIIGIPRVIFLHKMFPLFRTMFTNLGFDVLLSPLTSEEIVRSAQKYSIAETCYPIKLINGHIAWLLEHGAEYILLPRLYTIKHKGSTARKDYSCIYMQTSPLLTEQAFHFKERGVKLIMPELSLNFGKKYMIRSLLSIAPQIGRNRLRMIPALIKGMKALFSYSDKLEAIATDFLDTDEPVFVLISRVYNIIDPVLNMGIEKELHRMGCRVVHLEHLKASVMHVHTDYGNLCWPFGQHQLTGIEILRRYKNLYPIYITNHGCGPDTALQHYIEKELEDREYLHLEVDEHSSKVGIITRLEAFLYSLGQNGVKKDVSEGCTDLNCSNCNLSAEHKHVSFHDQKIKPHDEIWLLPDLGIYTRLLCSEVPAGAPIQIAAPLKEHRSFNYAINKEYYSLLLMLEEIQNTATPGKKYNLLFPTDEGAEVFSQYGKLIKQELDRKGIETELLSPFIEDIPTRSDYKEFYLKMLISELSELTGENFENCTENSMFGHSANTETKVLFNRINTDTTCERLQETAKELAIKAGIMLQKESRKKVLVVGEPLCTCKPAIFNRLNVLGNSCMLIPMPLSEALLFHLKDIDRNEKYKEQLKELMKIHNNLDAAMGENSIFTDLKVLFKAAHRKLDFCVGNMERYRLAKLLTAKKPSFDGIVSIQSNEENAGIVGNALLESYESQIKLPSMTVNLDFEHGPNIEEAEIFKHYL